MAEDKEPETEQLHVAQEAVCVIITPDKDGKGHIEILTPEPGLSEHGDNATNMARLMLLFLTDESAYMQAARLSVAKYLQAEGKLDLETGQSRVLH